MSDVVIKVENVSKQYRLGVVGTGTISHDLNRWWCRLRGKEDPTLKVTETNVRDRKAEKLKTEKLKENQGDSTRNNEHSQAKLSASQHFSVSDFSSDDYVWALKDINFEVKRGEVLGIIGRNGAGKSTLLKILSRVTAPTTGEIKVKGRIASLLEVGTGFHPELTGRENIYLNGAINGMTKTEVTAKLDEIVEFSGCERYIDTPVKRYSSGMTVRLGFAVAAHLEPEILIVDEVLAVGDAEFQKKCIGKMKDVAGHGRTVLFVSHNMAAVENLCDRCMLLIDGEKHKDGSVANVTAIYYALVDEVDCKYTFPVVSPHGVSVDEFEICSTDLKQLSNFSFRQPISFVISGRLKKPLPGLNVAIRLTNSRNVLVAACNSEHKVRFRQASSFSVVCHLQQNSFVPDNYRVECRFFQGPHRVLELSDVASFKITPTPYNSDRIFQTDPNSITAPDVSWELV